MGHVRAFQGPKEKYKDKVMDKEKDKEQYRGSSKFLNQYLTIKSFLVN